RNRYVRSDPEPATNRPAAVAAFRTSVAGRVLGRPRSARAAPPGRRPHARDGTADDPVGGDPPEVARVLRVRAVVAHHEHRPGPHLHGPEVDAVDRLVVDERLAHLAAVDDQDTVLE